jgi:hypothetical protein
LRLQTLLLCGARRLSQSLGYFKEFSFLTLSSIETRFDQFDDDPICTRTLALRDASDSAGDPRRQTDTLANAMETDMLGT